MTEEGSMKQKSSRIPLALQAVFLASNRGNEVHQPPPDKSASKVFFGNWLFQRRGTGKQKEKVSRQEISLSTRTSMDSVTMHSPSTLSTESLAAPKEYTITPRESTITPKEYTINVKMRRQESRISSLSTSTHSIHSTRSIRSFDSIASGTSSEKETNWLSPQGYLDVFLRSRGLSTERFKVLQTGYSSKPTPLQKSSYDPFLVERVKIGDFQAVEKMLQAGISPNPCSDAGDSLIHLLCRRGDSKMLKLFLDYGASIQVADSLGRTPLHEVCWAVPCFDTIELILMADINLLHMVDGLGAAPLSYIRKDYWRHWIAFFKAKKHVFWPLGDTEQTCPPLTLLEPNTRPLSDPLCALSPKQAAMVAAGRVAPEDARSTPRSRCVSFEDDNEESDESDSDETDDDERSTGTDDDTKSFASDNENRDDTCRTTDTFDMNEMENLLLQLSNHVPSTRRGV